MNPLKDPYEEFEINKNASIEEIIEKYENLIEVHKNSPKRISEIEQAYRYLLEHRQNDEHIVCIHCRQAIKRTDLYCSQCGNSQKTEGKKDIKNMNTKSKKKIIIASIIAIMAIGGLIILSNQSQSARNPANINSTIASEVMNTGRGDYTELMQMIKLKLGKMVSFGQKTGKDLQRDRANTAGNISNMGLMAEKDGWLYFSLLDSMTVTTNSPYAQYVPVHKYVFYKMKVDGTNKTVLNNDLATSINVVDKWIYYVDSQNHKLYKMNTDGTNKIELFNGDAGFMNVVDNWIYFISFDDYFIYKMKTDGTELSRISDRQGGYINVVGGWIYFTNISDNYALYKIRIDGTEETKMMDAATMDINVVGDWIYYSNQSDINDKNLYPAGKIYKIKIDGTNNIKLGDDPVRYLNVSGDWIYYKNKLDEGGIYRIKIDGTNREQISSDRPAGLFVMNNKLYHIMNTHLYEYPLSDKNSVSHNTRTNKTDTSNEKAFNNSVANSSEEALRIVEKLHPDRRYEDINKELVFKNNTYYVIIENDKSFYTSYFVQKGSNRVYDGEDEPILDGLFYDSVGRYTRAKSLDILNTYVGSSEGYELAFVCMRTFNDSFYFNFAEIIQDTGEYTDVEYDYLVDINTGQIYQYNYLTKEMRLYR